MVERRIAHYEVLDEIGAGGMGVVYRARDTRLDREAAIKALPEDLAGDPERLARFEREAKLLASLNNPHIATGGEILRRAALTDEFASSSGKYFDNESGRFTPPHPEVLDPRKAREVVRAIEAVLADLLGQSDGIH
jgi:serine/threonine protein kinase